MGRSQATRGIAKDRVYDFKTAARIIGLSLGTFRKLPNRGLRIVDNSRPRLVRGADLIKFLESQAKGRKMPSSEGQFLCMRCQAQRDALDGVAEYVPTNGKTGRLVALCCTCKGRCSTFSSPAKVESLAGILKIRLADVA